MGHENVRMYLLRRKSMFVRGFDVRKDVERNERIGAWNVSQEPITHSR